MCASIRQKGAKKLTFSNVMIKNSFIHTQSLLAAAVVVLFTAFGAFIMSAIAGNNSTIVAATKKPDVRNAAAKRPTTSIDIPIGDFSGIDVCSAIEVMFSQGENAGTAKVNASETAITKLKLYVDDGILVAKYVGDIKGVMEKTVIRVSSPVLNSVKTSTASSVTVNGQLNVAGNLQVDAATASSISFGEVAANGITINAATASQVFFLVAEADNIKVNANTAADVKLRGLCAGSINANAATAADVTLSGRCNSSKVNASTRGEIKTRGLILETMPVRGSTSATSSSGVRKL